MITYYIPDLVSVVMPTYNQRPGFAKLSIPAHTGPSPLWQSPPRTRYNSGRATLSLRHTPSATTSNERNPFSDHEKMGRE